MSVRNLLTGATGFLGRRLVRSLLLRGERVVALVRAEDDDAARRRLLALIGRDCDESTLTVLAAELPDNIPVAKIDAHAPYDHVWHLAALLDLGGRKRSALNRANVQGTSRILDHAAEWCRGRFHHVSTAYSCGLTDGPVPEEGPPPGRGHRNEYERTKQEAELLVQGAMAAGLEATIYRPSIVVGDSRTGRTEVFGAFYQVVRACHMAREIGPIVVPGDPETTLDIVPVDRVVEAMLALAVHPEAAGRTFHLTSPEPALLRELMVIGNAHRWSDVEAIRDVPLDDLPWPSPAVLRPAQALLPYLRTPPEFDRANADRLLGSRFLEFKGNTREALTRLMAHAVASGFGVDPDTASRERRILRRMSARGSRHAEVREP